LRRIEFKKKYYIKEIENKRIGFKTILFGLMGGSISCVIGGYLWGTQMLQSNRIFYIFAVGLVLLNYVFINGFTKKSYKNPVVVILTILFFTISLYIGNYIYVTGWEFKF